MPPWWLVDQTGVYLVLSKWSWTTNATKLFFWCYRKIVWLHRKLLTWVYSYGGGLNRKNRKLLTWVYSYGGGLKVLGDYQLNSIAKRMVIVFVGCIHPWCIFEGPGVFATPGTAKLMLQRQITKISRAAWWPCACLQFASKVSAVHELEMGVIPGVSLEGARAAFTATLNRPSRIIMRFGCHFLHILHDGLPWVSGC